MEVKWRNYNPKATETYGSGFSRKLVLTGGWYDKLGNLYRYYKNLDFYSGADPSAPAPLLTAGPVKYPAAWWDPYTTITLVTNKAGLMTGLAAPKPEMPADADHDGVWEYKNA
jgi:hypothetical protein